MCVWVSERARARERERESERERERERERETWGKEEGAVKAVEDYSLV